MISCDAPGGAPDWCPRTTDDVLPSVLGSLPLGPAWDAGRIDGSVQNKFWRSYASVLAYTYGRLCDYMDEFYCSTVKESYDQWAEEYGLNNDCDIYGGDLCLKVTSIGGQNCDYFVEVARRAGWVITCENVEDPEPIAGCFEVGCTGMGPTPVFTGGTTLGYGRLGGCANGSVVDHPEPQFWEDTKTVLARCRVPGSNLGLGPDVDESCCFIVGWYEMPVVTEDIAPDACASVGDTIYFPCPQGVRPPLVFDGTDVNGNYLIGSYTNAYCWKVTVDMAASGTLQGVVYAAPEDPPLSNAGNFIAGCTPLCTDAPQQQFVLCYLEKIKPAHTVLITEVTY